MNKFSQDSLQNSKSAEALKSYVPYEIQKSYIFNEIFNAYGEEFDRLEINLSDLFLQVLPQTATEWGLKFWEQRVGIPTNTSKTIEDRRARILTKLINKGTTTVEVIKKICRNYAREVEVIQHNSEYYFELNLSSDLGFPYSLDSMHDSIDIVKPAHLGIKYKLIFQINSKVYNNLVILSGEKVTIYPYTPNTLETKSEIKIAIGQNTGVESVIVFPLEGSAITIENVPITTHTGDLWTV